MGPVTFTDINKESSHYLAWIPPESGYTTSYKHNAKKKQIENIVESITNEEKRKEAERRTAWLNINRCPDCGGTDLFKHSEGGRYYVQCENTPKHVFKEIDALYDGVKYEPSSRAMKGGETPLSHEVKSLGEYIDKIQDRLCRWKISI